jgi:hypothetical protein
MSKIHAFLGALALALSCAAIGCAAETSEPTGAETEEAAGSANQAGATGNAEQVGETTQALTTCYSSCMKGQENDPYAAHNCSCICYGKPGKTCWLE